MKILQLLIVTFVFLKGTGCQKEENIQTTNVKLINVQTPSTQSAWSRYMYIDRSDTVYNSTQGSQTLARYLYQYKFNGVYLYSTQSYLRSSSSYQNFSNFNKLLSNNGILLRAVVYGNADPFGTGSSSSTNFVTAYNNWCQINYPNDPTRTINKSCLENEWWNGACTWSEWNSINQKMSVGTLSFNDFYEGWYKNLGTTIDTVAAKFQVRYSDDILLHDYVNGIPTYAYANAKSAGATGGRLDIIASGARQENKKIDLYIIISAENTAWGSANTFTGPALAAAAGNPNPFEYIETQVYNDMVLKMTPFQKQWINLKGFIWFRKFECYKAIPPR